MSTGKAWIRLPLELLKRDDFTKSDAVLLGVLIDQIQERDGMKAAISQERLAKLCGVSIRTIKRAEQHLESLGLIERRRTGRETVYELKSGAELLPPKRRRRQANTNEDELREEYLSLVNRFEEE